MPVILSLIKSPMVWVVLGFCMLTGYLVYEWQEKDQRIGELKVTNSKLVNANKVLKANIEVERDTIEAMSERLDSREGSVEMICKAWDKANEDTEDPIGGVLDTLPNG